MHRRADGTHHFEFPRAEITFVCVGRLCEQKGQLVLLKAAAILKSRGLRYKLFLIGDGDMRGILERTIQRRGLREQV